MFYTNQLASTSRSTHLTRAYSGRQSCKGVDDKPTWILDQIFPSERAAPMVTVLDGHPHTLAFLPAINGMPSKSLGVSRFGQVGSLDAVYRYHGIDSDSIVRAVLGLAK